MKIMKIVPSGWPCELAECPPGFFVSKDNLCIKTEYHCDKLSEPDNSCNKIEGNSCRAEAAMPLLYKNKKNTQFPVSDKHIYIGGFKMKINAFDIICIGSATDSITDPVQSVFWQSLISDIDDIYDGSDCEVKLELEACGIDVDKSEKEFSSFLDTLRNEFQR